MSARQGSHWVLAVLAVAVVSTARAEGPSDEIVALDGRRVSLASYKGKVVVLEFWATWCDVCLKEVPKINRLHESGKGKWAVLAVNVDESDRSKVSDFARRHDMKYPVFVDPAGDMRWKFGIRGLPTTIVLDVNGEIVQKVVGPRDWDNPKSREEIEKFVPRPTDATSTAPQPKS